MLNLKKINHQKEEKKLLSFFDGTLRRYYPHDSKIVGWSTKKTQETRFRILLEIAELDGSSVLDAGCGVGDLFGYLKLNNINVEYLGFDLHPKMIEHAKKKYPEGKFKKSTLEKCKDTADYVFASGTFNLLTDDNYEYIIRQAKKMVSLANKGVAFNLLSSYAPKIMRYFDLFYYDPAKVLQLCKENFGNAKINHDYLPNDFTVYLSV